MSHDLAYVAIVSKDVDRTVHFLQRTLALTRTDIGVGSTSRTLPTFAIGKSALAVFATGDPFLGGEAGAGLNHIAFAASDPEQAATALQAQGPPGSIEAGRGLANGKRVALVGRRSGTVACSQDALATSSILDLPSTKFASGAGDLSALALDRVASPDVRGFWIHLDVDVLNPRVMPAVDSPEPGGPTVDELVHLLAPLVGHPLAVGLDLSIYDPALDADRSGARRLVGLLEQLATSVK